MTQEERDFVRFQLHLQQRSGAGELIGKSAYGRWKPKPSAKGKDVWMPEYAAQRSGGGKGKSKGAERRTIPTEPEGRKNRGKGSGKVKKPKKEKKEKKPKKEKKDKRGGKSEDSEDSED